MRTYIPAEPLLKHGIWHPETIHIDDQAKIVDYVVKNKFKEIFSEDENVSLVTITINTIRVYGGNPKIYAVFNILPGLFINDLVYLDITSYGIYANLIISKYNFNFLNDLKISNYYYRANNDSIVIHKIDPKYSGLICLSCWYFNYIYNQKCFTCSGSQLSFIENISIGHPKTYKICNVRRISFNMLHILDTNVIYIKNSHFNSSEELVKLAAYIFDLDVPVSIVMTIDINSAK